MPAQQQQKRVAIVGAGCAGLSAAYSLSLSPDTFEGTVFDGAPNVGGSATSHALPPGFGAEYLNEGVQGAPETFRNTFNLFHDVLGFQSKEIEMQISFGKGENFWTNIFPTQLIEEHKDNIKRFGGTLSTIKRFEPIFALVPVSKLLPMFRYPPAFGERIVFPLVALFFGTGNETRHISSAILARVFLDPSMRIFDYSPDSFLASLPTMLAFPELGRLYGAFRTLVEEKGNVKVRTSRAVTAVLRGAAARKAGGANVVVRSCATDSEGKPTGLEEEEEAFDELVMCCDADSALKILKAGSGPSWKENKVLGNVKYFWDISVTHHDRPYMQKHYELDHTDRWNADRNDKETQESFKWAKENWAPLYLIEEDEKDPGSVTMSFDLTTYQPQFYGDPAVGKGARRTLDDAPPTERVGKDEWKTKEHPLKDIKEGEQPRIYQTIFLDRDGFGHRWSRDEIDKEKILMEKWWKQQSHRWQHLVGTVALMWAINGTQHTRYAGGWTLVNMHESAVVSGFAAVYQLGASYPFAQDDEAARLFKLYLALAHMSRARKEDRQGFFA